MCGTAAPPPAAPVLSRRNGGQCPVSDRCSQFPARGAGVSNVAEATSLNMNFNATMDSFATQFDDDFLSSLPLMFGDWPGSLTSTSCQGATPSDLRYARELFSSSLCGFSAPSQFPAPAFAPNGPHSRSPVQDTVGLQGDATFAQAYGSSTLQPASELPQVPDLLPFTIDMVAPPWPWQPKPTRLNQSAPFTLPVAKPAPSSNLPLVTLPPRQTSSLEFSSPDQLQSEELFAEIEATPWPKFARSSLPEGPSLLPSMAACSPGVGFSVSAPDGPHCIPTSAPTTPNLSSAAFAALSHDYTPTVPPLAMPTHIGMTQISTTQISTTQMGPTQISARTGATHMEAQRTTSRSVPQPELQLPTMPSLQPLPQLPSASGQDPAQPPPAACLPSFHQHLLHPMPLPMSAPASTAVIASPGAAGRLPAGTLAVRQLSQDSGSLTVAAAANMVRRSASAAAGLDEGVVLAPWASGALPELPAGSQAVKTEPASVLGVTCCEAAAMPPPGPALLRLSAAGAGPAAASTDDAIFVDRETLDDADDNSPVDFTVATLQAAGGVGERRRGGRVGRGSNNRITLEFLRGMFEMSVQEVVKALGISATDLKRRCRALGIHRWPQRKLLSLRRLAEAVEADKEISNEQRQEMLARIARNRAEIFANPDVELEAGLKPLRQVHYKRSFIDRRGGSGNN